MLGKVAADLLGISEIGSVIKPEHYDKVDADDYVMHEDNEKIYFLIKSKTDEYCFTNQALIHLDGQSAISKKRTLHRYNYSTCKISNVLLETAGTVDLDIEIKFTIGSVMFSIDVHKKHIEEIKDLYKALLKIEELSYESETNLNYAKQSMETALEAVKNTVKHDGGIAEQFRQINDAAFSWLVESRKQYKIKDFGFVFEKYINM